MLRSVALLGFGGAVCLGGLLAHVEDSLAVVPVARAGCDEGQRALARVAEECAIACDDATDQSLVLISYADAFRSCLDCSTVCRATAAVAERGGATIGELAIACAAACKECAAQCQRTDLDPRLEQLARACRACESACREVGS